METPEASTAAISPLSRNVTERVRSRMAGRSEATYISPSPWPEDEAPGVPGAPGHEQVRPGGVQHRDRVGPADREQGPPGGLHQALAPGPPRARSGGRSPRSRSRRRSGAPPAVARRAAARSSPRSRCAPPPSRPGSRRGGGRCAPWVSRASPSGCGRWPRAPAGHRPAPSAALDSASMAPIKRSSFPGARRNTTFACGRARSARSSSASPEAPPAGRPSGAVHAGALEAGPAPGGSGRSTSTATPAES